MSLVHPDFYKDPFGGAGVLIVDHPDRRTWARRVAPDKWETVTIENVEPVMETNAALRSINQGKKWKDGRVVASIPESVFYRGDVKKAFDENDQQWLKKFLNSGDNAKLRTFEGKL
jgi:hypothetical protein